jgi:hypothetical protein
MAQPFAVRLPWLHRSTERTVGPERGFDVPLGTLPVYQHWPGSWRPAEGTWDWAASIGLRAVAVESQDHFEGPPTRPSLRKQYFARDKQLHGTGELVSWAAGKELAPLGLEAVLEGLEVAYRGFVAGESSEADTEKRVCDLFMAARCGDYLDRLLAVIRSRPCSGWVGAICRALQRELLVREPSELLDSRLFWRRSLMPELVRAMPPGEWKGSKGFKRDQSVRFGEVVLWSAGASGQVLREAIHVDWTDLVLEQGLMPSLVGRNALDPANRSFVRWLVRPLRWKCLKCGMGPTAKEALRNRLVAVLRDKQPELGPIGWRVGPDHWARILEWVLVWRREITNPEMLGRAQALAALMVLDDCWTGFGSEGNPIGGMTHEHETPRAVGDIPVRLRHTVEWTHPQDFRLTDELYPAIAAVVAAWLRAAGHASCASDVFSKASWLKELLPVRRLRLVEVLKSAATFVREGRDDIRVRGVDSAGLSEHLLRSLGITASAYGGWLRSQATGTEAVERFAVELSQTAMFALAQQQHLPERVMLSGTALPTAINGDVVWGLMSVAMYLRRQPVDHSAPAPKSGAQVGPELACAMAG